MDEGALCLSWWHVGWSGFPEANRSHPHEDKHKAPTHLRIHPLSLQDAGRPSQSFRKGMNELDTPKEKEKTSLEVPHSKSEEDQ